MSKPQIIYPEGPLLHKGSLYFVDYAQDLVYKRGQNENVFLLPRNSGPASLAYFSPQQEIIVACYDAHKIYFIESKQELHIQYPNDMVADANGGVFVTSSAANTAQCDPFTKTALASGAIYFLHPNGSLSNISTTFPAIHYANGIGIYGTKLFVSEHLQNRLLSFDISYDVQGYPTLTNRTVFVDLPKSYDDHIENDLLGPDGMAIDSKGNVYVAHFGSSHVLVYNQQGELERTIKCPLPNVTNVTIVSDTKLYITMTSNKYDFGMVKICTI